MEQIKDGKECHTNNVAAVIMVSRYTKLKIINGIALTLVLLAGAFSIWSYGFYDSYAHDNLFIAEMVLPFLIILLSFFDKNRANLFFISLIQSIFSCILLYKIFVYFYISGFHQAIDFLFDDFVKIFSFIFVIFFVVWIVFFSIFSAFIFYFGGSRGG